MQNAKFQVVFEDPHILIVDKSAGLITAQTDTGKETTLEDILKTDLNIDIENAGLVHRLDKDTSGLLVVAKNQSAKESLHAQFKERKVKKEYLALVHGVLKESGEINVSIGRNPERHDKFTAIEDGRESVTGYEPLEQWTIDNGQLTKIFDDFNKIQLRKLERMNYNQFTLLSCKPLTGRTHQIRVHLKYINHPIVGDRKYGGRKTVRFDLIWCPRQFLHARSLGFFHPQTNKWMEFKSELPEDLKEVLNKLQVI